MTRIRVCRRPGITSFRLAVQSSLIENLYLNYSVSSLLPLTAWLTDLSLGIKETYDDNIFAAGADSRNHGWIPATNVPPGSVVALKGESSFVTTVSPKLGVNFAPLLGDQKTVQSLSLAYNPDFVTYHQASSESYNIHRLIGGVKIKADAFSEQAKKKIISCGGTVEVFQKTKRKWMR